MLIKDLYRKTAKLKGVKLLKMQQKTRTFKDLAKGAWRARRARAYNGGLGRSLQRGPGAEPLVWRSGGKAPWSWSTFCFWTFNALFL